MKDYQLIFINGTPLSDSLFDSHIITYLKELQKAGRGADILLSLTEDADAESEPCRHSRERLKEIPGLNVIFLKQTPMKKGFRPLMKNLSSTLTRIKMDHPRIIFHANSYLTGYILLRVLGSERKQKVIVDFKGILPQECLHYDPVILPMRVLRYLLALYMQRHICAGADALTVVSQAFKTHLAGCHDLNPDRIHVVPSCVDTEIFRYDPEIRTQIRKNLGLGDACVILYNGSLRKWQLPEQMFAFFKTILQKKRDMRFLFLTSETDKARQYFTDSGIPGERFHVIRALGRDLAGYLMAGDVGLLLRKQDLVNHVASPTKFAEYLGCGLPVLCTDGIGDISSLVRAENLGWIMKDPFSRVEREEILEQINKAPREFLSDGERSRRFQIALREFSWNNRIPRLLELYEKLVRT